MDNKISIDFLYAKAKKLTALKKQIEIDNENIKDLIESYDELNLFVYNLMQEIGIEELTLTSGEKISIEKKFYISPNKNKQDKKKIYEWLVSMGAGHLVDKKLTIDEKNKSFLMENKIDFNEEIDFNSSKLKAFIISGLGENDNYAQFEIENVPKCINLFVKKQCKT